jgi:hypothetical protein
MEIMGELVKCSDPALRMQQSMARDHLAGR